VIRRQREGQVCWLILDAPERLNSFTPEGYRECAAELQNASSDPDIHVIVLSGIGRAFSAGADRALVSSEATGPERAAAGTAFKEFLAALAACEKPLIAAVNGLAVGVGCTMLLYCDLVLAAETARFRMPFAQLGITPEAGSSVLLPARVRWDAAVWALLSSEWMTAAEAQHSGLVWRVVADDLLVAEATKAAQTISAVDPAVVAATKRLLIAGRAELVESAIARELGEMSVLREQRVARHAADSGG
jgi:enoyl-CoA hydratase/carnithine racemase